MFWADAGLLQEPPQPQYTFFVDIGMVQSRCRVQDQRVAVSELQFQAMA